MKSTRLTVSLKSPSPSQNVFETHLDEATSQQNSIELLRASLLEICRASRGNPRGCWDRFPRCNCLHGEGAIDSDGDGICDANDCEIADCNGDCYHEWYLQFPGVGNGFCNDPWINVEDGSIGGGSFNMVDESNLDLGTIFTINSYGGFYENLFYICNVWIFNRGQKTWKTISKE